MLKFKYIEIIYVVIFIDIIPQLNDSAHEHNNTASYGAEADTVIMYRRIDHYAPRKLLSLEF